jgi:phosphoserine phosphatase
LTKVLLTRHGHVEGIQPERFRGRTELELTERGIAEAHALAARIAITWKPVAVYTSPQQRAVVTGEIVAKACGVGTGPLDGLVDIDYGAWQMRIQDEVKAEAPDAFRKWREQPQSMRFPGGESLQDVVQRTAASLRQVLERHPADTVVLVGHDSVNRVLLGQFLDQPLRAYWRLAQSPACLNEIDVEGGDIRIERINDTSHLDRSP